MIPTYFFNSVASGVIKIRFVLNTLSTKWFTKFFLPFYEILMCIMRDKISYDWDLVVAPTTHVALWWGGEYSFSLIYYLTPGKVFVTIRLQPRSCHHSIPIAFPFAIFLYFSLENAQLFASVMHLCVSHEMYVPGGTSTGRISVGFIQKKRNSRIEALHTFY